jgi:tRNA (guanine37-N1)-methyltransferase
MKIKIITLFPEMFNDVFNYSIISRASQNKLVDIEIYNLRDWAKDRHKTVDDKPYGGGSGMVIKANIIDSALEELRSPESKIILLTPQGKKLEQNLVKKISKEEELILICGRYEGFDERVRKLVDIELSIGDYILSGGEIAAMVIVDTITRLLPGAVGKKESIIKESFSRKKVLDYPEYTRPEEFKPKSKNSLGKLKVPNVLLSGNHKEIKNWRKKKAIEKTNKRK